jgi:hypothetical protein
MPATGSDAGLGIQKQNSFGTTLVTSMLKVPFVTQGLDRTEDEVFDPALQGRFDRPDPLPGFIEGGGDIPISGNPLTIGLFLEAVLGQRATAIVGSVYQHTFDPRTTHFDADYSSLQPYSIAADVGELNTNSLFLYSDCIFNTLEISQNVGEPLAMTAGIVARDATFIAKPTFTSYVGNVTPIMFNTFSLSLDGAGIDRMENFSISINNNVAGAKRLNNTRYAARLMRDGFFEVDFNATIDFSNADWLKFKANSTFEIIAYWEGLSSISSGYNESLKITLPKCKIKAYPTGVGGPGVVTVPMTGIAYFHSGSLNAIEAILTNTVASWS